MSERPSLVIDPDSLSPDEQVRDLKLAEADREAGAEALGVDAVNALNARIRLWRRGRLVHVEGEAAARLRQTCVVTLEPLETSVDTTFERVFDPTLAEWPEDEAEIDLTLEGDGPEPLTDGVLDLWQIVFEELSLATDPFPRSEGAELDRSRLNDDDTEAAPRSPFAALASLKQKADGGID